MSLGVEIGCDADGVGERDALRAEHLVRVLDGPVGQDRADLCVEMGKDALRLAEGVGTHDSHLTVIGCR